MLRSEPELLWRMYTLVRRGFLGLSLLQEVLLSSGRLDVDYWGTISQYAQHFEPLWHWRYQWHGGHMSAHRTICNAICDVPGKVLEGLKHPVVESIILAMAAAGMLFLATK